MNNIFIYLDKWYEENSLLKISFEIDNLEINGKSIEVSE